MSIFNFFKRRPVTESRPVPELIPVPQPATEIMGLYDELDQEFYTKYENGWRRRDKGEGMAVLERLVIGYWKPRYLLDTCAREAYEIMSAGLKLRTIRDEDIDWESLKALSAELIDRVHDRDAFFPTMIRSFKDGKAELEWQINPDGRYYMDDDGFGMTDDEEVALYGTIDRTGRVVEKMHYKP